MPRFYFDVTGGGKPPFRDIEGLLFVTVEAATAHAMTLLPIMGVELPLTPGEFRSWSASVREESGRLVGRFVLAIINDNIDDDAANRVLSPMR